MRRLLIALALACLTGGLLTPATAAATRVTISGTVTAKDGSGPIQNIEVCATTTSGVDRCKTSGKTGSYKLTVPKGKYVLSAGTYSRHSLWVDAVHNQGRAISVSSNLTLNWSMVRGAIISGHRRDAQGGEPSHNDMSVTAFPIDSAGKPVQGSQNFYSMASETGGLYQIEKLPPGRYRLQFVDRSSRPRYARQWYPHATVASASSIVTVQAGQEVENRDLTLSKASALSFAVTHKGKAVKSLVELFDADGRLVWGRDTNSKGQVSYTGLAAGAYRVRVSPHAFWYSEWYGNQKRLASAKPITLAEGITASRSVVLHYPTLTARKKPVLRRSTNTFKVKSKGSWNARPSHYAYQWYRDGKKLRDQEWTRIVLRDRDRGHRFKLCITTSRKSYADGRSCTKYTRRAHF